LIATSFLYCNIYIIKFESESPFFYDYYLISCIQVLVNWDTNGNILGINSKEKSERERERGRKHCMISKHIKQ
jgi:hypothetical protein